MHALPAPKDANECLNLAMAMVMMMVALVIDKGEQRVFAQWW
jgi:hypothetical protein